MNSSESRGPLLGEGGYLAIYPIARAELIVGKAAHREIFDGSSSLAKVGQMITKDLIISLRQRSVENVPVKETEKMFLTDILNSKFKNRSSHEFWLLAHFFKSSAETLSNEVKNYSNNDLLNIAKGLHVKLNDNYYILAAKKLEFMNPALIEKSGYKQILKNIFPILLKNPIRLLAISKLMSLEDKFESSVQLFIMVIVFGSLIGIEGDQLNNLAISALLINTGFLFIDKLITSKPGFETELEKLIMKLNVPLAYYISTEGKTHEDDIGILVGQYNEDSLGSGYGMKSEFKLFRKKQETSDAFAGKDVISDEDEKAVYAKEEALKDARHALNICEKFISSYRENGTILNTLLLVATAQKNILTANPKISKFLFDLVRGGKPIFDVGTKFKVPTEDMKKQKIMPQEGVRAAIDKANASGIPTYELYLRVNSTLQQNPFYTKCAVFVMIRKDEPRMIINDVPIDFTPEFGIFNVKI